MHELAAAALFCSISMNKVTSRGLLTVLLTRPPLSPAHTPPPGFHIPQEVPAHSWLRRGVAAPINRYQIKPGRHWDGVDRSNGFEKQMFKGRNEKAARDAEARAWAMSDM